MIRLSSPRALIAVAVGAAFVLAAAFFMLAARLPSAPALDTFGDAPTFALTDHLERPFGSDQLRGKVVVANFIYTSCQDICPGLSAQMQSLQERLRREGLLGKQTQLLSFSVDPARDTPAVLRAYAERLRADQQAWRFLTGPEEQVVPLIVQGFHLGVQALPPPTASHDTHSSAEHEADYDVTHSGRFVLIDPAGRIRAYYDGREFDIERVVADIRSLLP